MVCRGLHAPAVESFVFHRIDPSEIVGVTTPTDFSDCKAVLENVTRAFAARAVAAEKACMSGTTSWRANP